MVANICKREGAHVVHAVVVGLYVADGGPRGTQQAGRRVEGRAHTQVECGVECRDDAVCHTCQVGEVKCGGANVHRTTHLGADIYA